MAKYPSVCQPGRTVGATFSANSIYQNVQYIVLNVLLDRNYHRFRFPTVQSLDLSNTRFGYKVAKSVSVVPKGRLLQHKLAKHWT
jgi:hypothetical protein